MIARFDFEGRQNKAGRRRLAYATLCILVVFAIDLLSGGSVRAIFQRAGTGLWIATARVRSAIFDSGYFETHGALARENLALRDQLSAYTEKSAAYEVMAAENEALRALINLAEAEKGITAPIVSSVRSSPYGTFLIGAGESDGIVPGSLVLTEGGFVVGRVVEVRKRTTLVTEIFAGGASVDVVVGGALAAAEGRGGGNARLSIPRGVEVAVSDPVIAPQLGGRPIGLVGKVEFDTSSAAQTVYVHLPINLSGLRYVYIIPAQNI